MFTETQQWLSKSSAHAGLLLIQAQSSTVHSSGTFAKLLKATISFVTSVCPSVRPYGTTRLPLNGFSWNLTWEFFENLSRKFTLHYNLKRITGTLHEDLYTFMIISRSILLRMRNVLDKLVEEIETHILYSKTFFQKWCHLWYNVKKYGTAGEASDDNITWRMRFACWIT